MVNLNTVKSALNIIKLILKYGSQNATISHESDITTFNVFSYDAVLAEN